MGESFIVKFISFHFAWNRWNLILTNRERESEKKSSAQKKEGRMKVDPNPIDTHQNQYTANNHKTIGNMTNQMGLYGA